MEYEQIIEELTKKIEDLEEENRSLWFMIEELSSSKIENHKDLFKTELSGQLEDIKSLLKKKVAKA
jgi:predicted RNase H-like nuclease (RuvC/YqgF family)